MQQATMWMPARLRHAAFIGLLAAGLVAALITACGSSKIRASTAVTPVTPLKGQFARNRCCGRSTDELCLPGSARPRTGSPRRLRPTPARRVAAGQCRQVVAAQALPDQTDG